MKTIITILSIVIVACSSPTEKSHVLPFKQKTEADSLIVKWKLDSLGCLGLRNDKAIKEIFEKYLLKDKDKVFLKETFGVPNEEYQTERYYGLRYYCNNGCKEGLLPKEVDKCWYEILVSKKQNEEAGYAKACQ